jgi:hypothetical protein
MTAIKALQDEELMAQGKDFSSQSCLSWKAGWYREKQGDEEGKRGSDTPWLCKFNRFYKNELFGRGSQLTSFSLNSPSSSPFVLDFSHYAICFPASLLE